MLSTTQAAEKLGVSVATVKNWCAAGRLPGAERVGKTWVIPDKAINLVKRPSMGRPGPNTKNGSAW